MANPLFLRKSVDQLRADAAGEHHQLRRSLGALDLVMLGIGAIIGTGIFVLTGTAAARNAGPAVALSFVVAGIASAFAGLCYAEMASMIPVAGSAYTYSYATMGELVAWIIGWDLVLEYLAGAATVSVGWSGYVVAFVEHTTGYALPKTWTTAPIVWDDTLNQVHHTGSIVNLPAVLIVLAVTAILVVGIKESARFNSVIVFVKVIVVITLIVESVGALILSVRFSFDMDVMRALYFGVFHAVSAFNNAGFSLFSENLNLDAYRTDLTVNLTISALIVLGGIGFLVYRDILDNLRGVRFRLSTHTKLALLVSLVLIVGGALGIWAFEIQNEKTLAAMPLGDQMLVAYFHSVSARTAGFNTIDMSLVATPTLYLIILLMVVGASPGGTGGGIKTTTFGIVCASIWGTLKGRADVMMFHRRIPQELVTKSYVLAALALGLVTGFTMLLSYLESQSFLAIMFEVASAAGTVGLSVGNGGVLSLSALFSDFGKCVIIATMFLGRLGPLAIGLFAVKTHEDLRYRYAQARVVLG